MDPNDSPWLPILADIARIRRYQLLREDRLQANWMTRATAEVPVRCIPQMIMQVRLEGSGICGQRRIRVDRLPNTDLLSLRFGVLRRCLVWLA